MLYLLVPIGAFLVRLARAPGNVSGVPGLGDAVVVSLETATLSTAIIALLGVPLAYLLAHGRSRGSLLLGVLLQLPLAFPPLVSGILLLYLLGPYTPLGELANGTLTDSRIGIICSQVFVAAPFAVIAARSAFGALDPGWEDVAATLGHRRWARFLRVAVPAAAPGIAAGLLLAWLRAFGEFGATVILAYHPYSLPVLTYVQFGSSGLPGTLTPVAVTLLAAFAVLLVAAWVPRLARVRRPGSGLPPPSRAVGTEPGPLLELHLRAAVGDFRIELAHRAAHRHLAVLGPSGAGKTMTLRLIAGLARRGDSQIAFDGTDISPLPPEHRAIGYVPQEPTLIPGLPVWRQAVFGVDSDPAVAAYWIDRLGLTELQERRPDELSGGQRRRVALVRALARSPRVLLLDEPSTGLDTAVRDEFRRELRALQRDTGLTTVLVTHDPTEAAMLAEEVLVVEAGRVLQAGPQPEVFAHPATPSVARLLGVDNLCVGRVDRPGRIAAGAVEFAVPDLTAPTGARVSWGIRAASVAVFPDDGRTSGYPALILDVVDFGSSREVTVDLGELQLAARTSGPYRIGDRCVVQLPPAEIAVWLDSDGELTHPG
ncbi:MAG TPA: ATP-binding cassette domain-containing protein [Mycobacteriales bacterium]|nr:ATP-binding cassette domain-containing protein [Mycobacteriales bacterium]